MDRNREEAQAALRSIASMLSRSEKAREKFAEGTSQNTLQKNRIHALRVAQELIRRDVHGCGDTDSFAKEQLEQARAPLASLISKSEKAREKCRPGTWQHTMLSGNLDALRRAVSLLAEALGEE